MVCAGNPHPLTTFISHNMKLPVFLAVIPVPLPFWGTKLVDSYFSCSHIA